MISEDEVGTSEYLRLREETFAVTPAQMIRIAGGRTQGQAHGMSIGHGGGVGTARNATRPTAVRHSGR